MAVYWNMRLGRFIYINSSLLNQSEPVSFELSKAESFGVDNAGFPKRIRTRMELVSRNEVI